MTNYTLRPARESDSRAIKDLIHLTGINPMGLDWRRFVVAVDAGDQVLGTGQLKPHGADAEILELSSIAVAPEQRGNGIARAVIEHLMREGARPLYLTCISSMGPLYAKFGFVSLTYDEMPRYFQRLSRLANVVMSFSEKDEHLLVMKLQ